MTIDSYHHPVDGNTRLYKAEFPLVKMGPYCFGKDESPMVLADLSRRESFIKDLVGCVGGTAAFRLRGGELVLTKKQDASWDIIERSLDKCFSAHLKRLLTPVA